MATTYHYTQTFDTRLGPYVEQILQNQFQKVSEGTLTSAKLHIEDCLLVLYNFGA
jgi:hypothetical protein